MACEQLAWARASGASRRGERIIPLAKRALATGLKVGSGSPGFHP